MNSPDEGNFKFLPAKEAPPTGTAAPGRFVIMYHGSIVERHGLDLAVTALARIHPTIPGAELRIYGRETPFLRQVLDSVPADLRAAVHYLGAKNLEQIAEAIRDCDVGVIPNRRSLFTEINTPTRIFEYLSQGKPVVAPRAPGILDYFGATELNFFELGDAEDLAKQLEQIFRDSRANTATVLRGQSVYREHAWSAEKLQFIGVVADLLGVASAPAVAGEKATGHHGP
jgi:glycosyltransferase involved in cell wall biosynthesis